jgi:hypothetical protein
MIMILKHTSRAVILAQVALSGCSHPQPVRDVAQLTRDQLAIMKIQGELQQKILAAQQRAFSSQISDMVAEARRPVSDMNIIVSDWSAGKPNDRRVALLKGTQQNDAVLLTDPYAELKGPSVEVKVITADLSGLDKAIENISRLTSEDSITSAQFSQLAVDVYREYQRLSDDAQQATSKVP